MTRTIEDITRDIVNIECEARNTAIQRGTPEHREISRQLKALHDEILRLKNDD